MKMWMNNIIIYGLIGIFLLFLAVNLDKNEPGMHSLKKEKPNILRKIYIYLKRRIISPEFQEQLKKIAWELQERFSHEDLAKASKLNKKTTNNDKRREGNEVLGWILMQYPQLYRKLIYDHRVVDLACLYAKRKFRIGANLGIDRNTLEEMEMTIIDHDPIRLKNFPEIKFDKSIVFTKTSFYDSVKPMNNQNIKINGMKTTGKKLIALGSLLVFISYNVPLIVITGTPGQHVLWDSKELIDQEKTEVIMKTLTKAFHQAKALLDLDESEFDFLRRQILGYAKRSAHAKAELERMIKINHRDEINRITKKVKTQQRKANTRWNINLTPIIVIIIIVIGVIILFLVIGYVLQLNQTPPSTEVIESAKLLSFLK